MVPGRMPFGWLLRNSHFFLHPPEELIKTNDISLSLLKTTWYNKMRKERRKVNIQGCYVQLYRLCTVQDVQQRRGVWLNSKPHFICSNMALARSRIHWGEAPIGETLGGLSQLTPVLPIFLSSFFSLSSVLTLAKILYEVSCNLFFSPRKG